MAPQWNLVARLWAEAVAGECEQHLVESQTGDTQSTKDASALSPSLGTLTVLSAPEDRWEGVLSQLPAKPPKKLRWAWTKGAQHTGR